MRIGIIGDALDHQYAGIHYFTKNIVEALISIDQDNEYFLLRTVQDDMLPMANTVIVTPANNNFISRAFRLFHKIPKVSKKLNLDVIIEPAHFGPFNLPSHIKGVTVIHDLTPILHSKWHPLASSILQKIFLPSIVKRADLIITNSDFTKSDIITHLKKDPDQIIRAHLGISDIFKPDRDLKKIHKYGIYKDYILYQGTLEPRKNLVNLIKGYELYRHNHPESNVQLILSGKTGWKANDVIKKRHDSFFQDDIILLGYVERVDMPALYSCAKTFVYPSFYEGFGLPVLEALACGASVIASKATSLPEVGGPYVQYFDPHNVDEIAQAITTSLAAAKDNIVDQIEYASSYTWESTARTILSAINDL